MISLYILIPLFVLLCYLVIDYRGPRYIDLYPATAFHMRGRRAKELVVQESDQEGNIWASRGLILYRLEKGENRFVRMAYVPSGFSFFWLNNFSLFRKFINKPECIEACISGQRTIVVMSAGYMWYRPINERKFRRSIKLTHYGMGVGRGVLNYGLKAIGDQEIFWGEYFRNSERGSVRIYHSSDMGKSWNVAHEFEPGFTRHIHAILQDPYTGRLWICMGDLDHESRIGWSDDGFRTITYIGSGSQIWRSSHLVFTEEAVYWGSDTGSVQHAGIYRWDKLTKTHKSIYKSQGAILFGTRLKGGSLLFSTDREGFPNEKDHMTRLLVLRDDESVKEIECGTWKHWKKGLRYSFAMLRFPRNQGISSIVMTVINQKEFPAGELILIEEEISFSYKPYSNAPRSGDLPL